MDGHDKKMPIKSFSWLVTTWIRTSCPHLGKFNDIDKIDRLFSNSLCMFLYNVDILLSISKPIICKKGKHCRETIQINYRNKTIIAVSFYLRTSQQKTISLHLFNVVAVVDRFPLQQKLLLKLIMTLI